MFQTLLVTVLSGFLIFWVLRRFSYWRLKGVPQHVVWSPFGAFTSFILQRRSFADVLNGLYNKFSDHSFFGTYIFFTPVLVLRDPGVIKDFAIKNADNFLVHKMFSNGDAEQAYSNNLFSTLSGSKWKNTRRYLNQGFTSSKLRSFSTIITECSKQWRASVNVKPGEIYELDIKHDVFNRFTNNVLANFIFGIDSNAYENKDSEFYWRSVESSDFSDWKVFASFGYCFKKFIIKLFNFRLITDETEHFYSNLLRNIMDMRKKSSIFRPDMVNYLMEAQLNNEEITDRDILGHSMLMISAGSDTPPSALVFLAYELAVNPDVQAKLYREIKSTLSASSTGELSYETLSEMTYLDMVISESLRKWPPLPFTDRANEQPQHVEIDGKTVHLEKGSILWIPIMCIHRDAKYYPEPERFDPERFSEENRGSIMKECYIPFGIGPRVCIGARLAVLMMKSIIVHIVCDFELVPVEKTPNPIELCKNNVFLHPLAPMRLGLKARRD